MALTFTKSYETVIGDLRLVAGAAAASASYPTGGETYTPSTFGLQNVYDVIIPSNSANGNNALGWVDKPNSKLKISTALGTEATNGSNQALTVFNVLVIGK